MVKEQFENLLIARIKVRRNVRKTFNKGALDGLLRSMREHGLLEPIRVQREDDDFIVINGESRLKCGQLLEWKTIPAIIVAECLSDAQFLEQQLVENIQRTDLPPLERAQGIRELIDLHKCNEGQAAARLAISNADVTRSLSLLTLPAAIQEMIRSGSVSPSVGYELSRIDDSEKQADLAQQAASGKLTRDALIGVRKAASRSKSEPETKAVSRVTAVLGADKSVTVVGQALGLDDFIAILEDCLAKARQGRTKGISLGTLMRMLKDTSHAM